LDQVAARPVQIKRCSIAHRQAKLHTQPLLVAQHPQPPLLPGLFLVKLNCTLALLAPQTEPLWGHMRGTATKDRILLPSAEKLRNLIKATVLLQLEPVLEGVLKAARQLR
jgi:hypothetical protein